MTATISAEELKRQLTSGKSLTLVDVRTPVEFREIHVQGAKNFPLDRLDTAAIAAERKVEGEPLYVICRSGSRGRQACEKLTAAGVANVVNVEGGTVACDAAGVAVVKGKKAISLERQVRIVAGSLVVVGAALTLVHPYFAALPAFIGAGLVFAGITDTCGMAMMLARMPWNQVAGGACKVALLLSLITLASTAQAVDHTKDSLDTVKQNLAQKKAVIIDVRELREWKSGHLAEASLLPLSELEDRLAREPEKVLAQLPQDKVIYLHCLMGGRCLQAAELLQGKGLDIRPLKPGINDLLRAGFPAAK